MFASRCLCEEERKMQQDLENILSIPQSKGTGIQIKMYQNS